MPMRLSTTLCLALSAALVLAPAAGHAQQTFQACYVPDVGALYLIGLEGLPTSCLATGHVEISWTEGDTTTVDHGALVGLADDDHPQYLPVEGVRQAVDGFAITSLPGSEPTTIPVEGNGARLMWFAGEAALRAGGVNGTQWDAVNIGRGSMGLGYHVTASGDAAVALGYFSTATASYATATGSGTTASGASSIAMGDQSTASGWRSTATGYNTLASAHGSTATGISTTASGLYTLSGGSGSEAAGNLSVALGLRTIAQAYGELAFGRYNVAVGNPGAWGGNDPLLSAGNGTDANTRSNALTLQKDGDLIIAGTLTESSDRRLKLGIEPLGPALDAVLAVRPVRFRFRDGTGHPAGPQIGLIAQDVEAAFPELVTRDGQGYLSLAYPKLTAVLVQAIHDQQAQLDALREENRRLLERIEGIEAALRERR